jgi:hypothetical protein
VTSGFMLNAGSHVPLGAACYPGVAFCVPCESCAASNDCYLTSYCVTLSDDLKNDVDFVALV